MAWKTLHFEWENHENRWKNGSKNFSFSSLTAESPSADWWLAEAHWILRLDQGRWSDRGKGGTAPQRRRLARPLWGPPNVPVGTAMMWWTSEYPMNIQWISNEHPISTTMNHVYELFPFLFVQGRTCVVAFLPHIFDDGAAGRNEKIKVGTISRFRRFWWFRPFK